jgi:hypothetical protein
VTAIAYELLADDGIALIQIRYDDGSERFRAKQRDYHRHALTFTSCGIAESWRMASETGFKPLAVSLSQESNYAYFYLQKDH